MTRWQVPTDDAETSTSTTAQENDYVLFSHPANNPAYTLVFGVVAKKPPLLPKQPVKYVFSRRPASQTARFEVPWFESPEESLDMPPATVVSLLDWPGVAGHPERLKCAYNLAELIAHFDQKEAEDWSAFSDSFSFFLKLHNSPAQRFKELAADWRSAAGFLSDTNEICGHPSYQQIIGMGILALPFLFAELEREPEHWFWALKAITGADPIPEEHLGNVELMSRDWLDWAEKSKQRLGNEWARVFLQTTE
jgi:hypothetical protein